MQLKRHAFIRGALAAATCTALGNAHATQEVDSWKLDSAYLYYAERDRITVNEPALSATKQVSEDESYTVRAVYDAMTGATPIGAAPAATTQTITSASGSGLIVAPGTLPMKSFSDRRVALGVDWNLNTSRLVKRSTSFNLSSESDYTSLGGSLAYAFDNENRTTTYSAGAGFSYDLVSPEAGVPTGMQSITAVATDPETTTGTDPETTTGASGGGGFKGERKTTVDMLLGITQVLSRRSLVQVNLSHSQISGYLNDPYKMVSVVDTSGLPVDYVWEKRPDNRTANSLFTKWVYHLPQDVIHLSYRYFSDSWGIKSHTADLTYHMELPLGFYFEPHGRYYSQTQADFYHTSLADGVALPDYASADYRLADFNSRTVGVKMGMTLANNSEVSLRVEKMVQRGNNPPADAIGTQKSLNMYPGLDATIMQISFSTLF